MDDSVWVKYTSLQAELLDNSTLSHRSWGLEGALNRILSADAPTCIAANGDNIEHIVGSEQRRERHRTALRRLQLPQEAPSFDLGPFLAARAELKSARAKVNGSDWNLLCGVAIGHSYAEIATAHGETVGALRVRVSRLRRRIA